MSIRNLASQHSLSLRCEVILSISLHAETLNTVCDRLRQKRMKPFPARLIQVDQSPICMLVLQLPDMTYPVLRRFMPTSLPNPSPSLVDPEIAGFACFTLKGSETTTDEFDLVLSLRLRSLAVFRKPGRTGGSSGPVSSNAIHLPISLYAIMVQSSLTLISPKTFS
jgi:hypothetical protein